MTFTPQYLGKETAHFYWDLWQRKTHISRRVDTYELIDRKRTRRSVTIDVDNRSLVKALAPDTTSRSLLIPVVLLHKRPLFDVDLHGANGQPLHLCRRYENMSVSAHILVGLCLSLGYNEDERRLFDSALTFLGYDRGSSAAEKQQAELCFTDMAIENLPRGALVDLLRKHINLLRDRYIQCVDYSPDRYNRMGIVKFRFTDRTSKEKADSILTISGRDDLRLSSLDTVNSYLDVNGDVIRLVDLWQKAKFCATSISGWWNSAKSKLLENIGIIATKFEVPIGFDLPNHLRIVAGKGLSIDDVRVLAHEDKTVLTGLNDGISTDRHREKASLLLRDLPDQRYNVLVKINTVPDVFLYPALVVSILQLAIMMIALQAGPHIVSRNPSAFTGTTLIAPFITVLFLARSSEHSLVTAILTWPRMLLLLSSIMTVISGVLISILPRPQFEGDEHYELIDVPVFWTLAVTVGLATICITLILLVLWRMHRMLKITEMRNVAIAQAILEGNMSCNIEDLDKRHQQDAIDNVAAFFFYGGYFCAIASVAMWRHFYSVWMG